MNVTRLVRSIGAFQLAAGLLVGTVGVGYVAAQATPKAAPKATAAAKPTVTVYKSATCGCCAKWNEHMRTAGFDVVVNDLPDVTPIKDKYHVPPPARSCHTAIVGGYVIEGHVPADLVQKLLKEQPKDVVGIATPGMPTGSPGMEVEGRKDAYNVVTFDKAGKTTVYAAR
jgi:hypothetical protein